MKTLVQHINESIEKKYVNMIVASPDDKILILRRANYMRKFKGLWGFPGGSLDAKDKDAKEAAIRELKEETGIELTWNEAHDCKKFDEIRNDDNSVSIYYIVKLKDDKEVKMSREHSKYEWFDKKSQGNHKWMPDVFQLIQKYYD